MTLKSLRKLSTWIVALSLFGAALSANAMADSDSLSWFFRSMEGTWNGRGSNVQIGPDGRTRETRYRVQTRVFYRGGNQWQFDADIRTEFGQNGSQTIFWEVHGNDLYASNGGAPWERVDVWSCSGSNIGYTFHQYDANYHQAVNYVFDLRLNSTGDLETRNSVDRDGRVVARDSALQRRRNP